MYPGIRPWVLFFYTPGIRALDLYMMDLLIFFCKTILSFPYEKLCCIPTYKNYPFFLKNYILKLYDCLQDFSYKKKFIIEVKNGKSEKKTKTATSLVVECGQ